MIASSADFAWHDDDSVVLREQPAIAIYDNPHGVIVIRQERPWDEDEDTIILVQPENARAIAEAILRVAAALRPEQARPPRKEASSGAERQRRYRERHTVTDGVTPSRYRRDVARDASNDAGVMHHLPLLLDGDTLTVTGRR